MTLMYNMAKYILLNMYTNYIYLIININSWLTANSLIITGDDTFKFYEKYLKLPFMKILPFHMKVFCAQYYVDCASAKIFLLI